MYQIIGNKLVKIIRELEEKNFRVNSEWWCVNFNDENLLISPCWWIVEIRNGEFKWEQLFNRGAAIRELNKAWKELPTYDELKNFITPYGVWYVNFKRHYCSNDFWYLWTKEVEWKNYIVFNSNTMNYIENDEQWDYHSVRTFKN